MGGRASKSSVQPPSFVPPPPERSDIRCRVSTWASFSDGAVDHHDETIACVGAVVYDAQRDRVLVAAGFDGGSRPTCILTYRFETRPPGNLGDASSSEQPAAHGVLEAGAWRVQWPFDGFVLAPPLRVHAWPPFDFPATKLVWCSSNSVIVHNTAELWRSIRHGVCTSISHHLRPPQRISAIAVDSRGHLAHIEQCAPVNDRHILWVHAISGLGLPGGSGSGRSSSSKGDNGSDGDNRITRSECLAPPAGLPRRPPLVGTLRWPSRPPVDDAIYVTKTGRREPKWMGLVAVAFDADDRIYAVDRGVASRRCYLYQSRAPLASPKRPPSSTLAGVETPCEWTLVADLSAVFAQSHLSPRDPVFLAIDTFQRRAYVAHSTCVYAVRLDGDSDDPKNGGGDGCGDGGTGGESDRDRSRRTKVPTVRVVPEHAPAVRVALGRVEILAGHPLRNGDRDGSGEQALFAGITGCAIRTRPVDVAKVAVPAVAAIRTAAVAGNGWPPGVAEIVESYARASGLPAASLVLSDHGGRRMRQIEFL